MVPNFSVKLLYVDTALEWVTLGLFLCLCAFFALVFSVVCVALAMSWVIHALITGDYRKLYDRVI